jgi:hypothetical protein
MDEAGVLPRLNRLEREVRWWRIVGGAVSGVLVLVLLGGAAGTQVAEEIRARRFVIVGQDGKARGWLGTSTMGTHLLLVDKNATLTLRDEAT